MNITDFPLLSQDMFQQSSCCATPVTTPVWQKSVDTMCRIAIGIFTAFYAQVPFVISLAVGVFTGSSYALVKLSQKKEMFPDGENKPVCAQGYMDFLSGMRFPPPVGTLATTSFIIAHTRHDPLFYAPFCGFFIGFGLGRDGMRYSRDLIGYAFQYFPFKREAAIDSPCCCKN